MSADNRTNAKKHKTPPPTQKKRHVVHVKCHMLLNKHRAEFINNFQPSNLKKKKKLPWTKKTSHHSCDFGDFSSFQLRQKFKLFIIDQTPF